MFHATAKESSPSVLGIKPHNCTQQKTKTVLMTIEIIIKEKTESICKNNDDNSELGRNIKFGMEKDRLKYAECRLPNNEDVNTRTHSRRERWRRKSLLVTNNVNKSTY